MITLKKLLMKNYLSKIVIAGILVSLLSNFVSAQTFLFQSLPKDNTQFGLRYLRPNFEADIDMSTFSGIYDLYVNIPASSSINLVGSIPFTAMAIEGEESESGIGDIYIGLQTRLESSTDNNSILSFGVFLPTASEDKYSLNFMGLFTNYYELQKYLPNTLTLYMNYAYHSTQPEGAMFGFEIGPNFWIPTDDNGDETELFIHYGFNVGFQARNLAIFTELAGIALITEDIDEFGDRFSHSLAFGAHWTGNTMRPGIFYKIYLKEDLSDVVDGVLGVKLETILE